MNENEIKIGRTGIKWEYYWECPCCGFEMDAMPEGKCPSCRKCDMDYHRRKVSI